MSVLCKLHGRLVFAALVGSLATPLWAQEARHERWEEARRAKVEQLEAEKPGPAERVLIAVEQSIEGGTLGRRVLGLKVYAWLLLLAALLVIGFMGRRVGRRLLRSRVSSRAP